MSVCTLIVSDTPLSPVAPSRDYPLHINLDTGTLYDGGADDNFFLRPFPAAADYTGKSGVCLDWHYTEGRAKRIIDYVRTALEHGSTVELWHLWLEDYWEFEERPYIRKRTIPITELTPALIRELDEAAIWNKPDPMYPQRPSFYCLAVTR